MVCLTTENSLRNFSEKGETPLANDKRDAYPPQTNVNNRQSS